ncbi:11970_t:CDS:10 [Ambispora leptoticha]|uniref:11970_t:CDS:1 n=1 Tax=Ambispora leptoticha TaxID=144679 RepID=A0A9N9C3N9_9GLOM|nr:11970_t:CDS:10 [Ambispora leptoticha]
MDLQLTLEDIPDWFLGSYVKKNRNAMDDEIIKAYVDGPVQQASGSSQTRELEKAFNISFRDPVGYLRALCQRIRQVADTDDHFNYLTIIQSSGYGKTRAGCELAAEFPFVYVCFRENGSTGYPPATPRSMDMLRNIKEARNIDEAEVEAVGWIRSIISTFHEKREEFCKKEPQERYQQALLKDQQQAIDFWNAVDANRENEEMPQTSKKIILFIDEASALLSKKKNQETVTEKNQAFRAVRRALLKYKAYITGLLTDTNSSVANLAPQIEHARGSNRKVHKPFIYLATMDCLSTDISLNENGSGHDIIRFGKPLWGSRWQSAESWETSQEKFNNIIQFAKFKLRGGTNQWDQNTEIKRKVSLAVIACIATLYISPISSLAPDLVKSHMATLIHIDDDRKKHLITYPSESVLAEAALEVLSENGVELGVLMELDAVNKSSGILDAGSQGELVVSFSVRRSVLKFLEELFELKLPKERFSYLKDFEVGFTHFIGLTEKPNISILKSIWDRRVIRHKADKERFGVLVVQVKNYAVKQNQTEETFAAGCQLEPRITFSEDCANIIKDNYLAIYVHTGAAYKDTPELNSFKYSPPTTRSSASKTAESSSSDNQLLVHGLGSFKSEYRNILESLLCARNDATLLCAPEDRRFLYYMLPCAYESAKKSDEQEESSLTAKKRKQSRKGRDSYQIKFVKLATRLHKMTFLRNKLALNPLQDLVNEHNTKSFSTTELITIIRLTDRVAIVVAQKILREKFAELHEAFQVQIQARYIFNGQLKVMNGGEITAS